MEANFPAIWWLPSDWKRRNKSLSQYLQIYPEEIKNWIFPDHLYLGIERILHNQNSGPSKTRIEVYPHRFSAPPLPIQGCSCLPPYTKISRLQSTENQKTVKGLYCFVKTEFQYSSLGRHYQHIDPISPGAGGLEIHWSRRYSVLNSNLYLFHQAQDFIPSGKGLDLCVLIINRLQNLRNSTLTTQDDFPAIWYLFKQYNWNWNEFGQFNCTTSKKTNYSFILQQLLRQLSCCCRSRNAEFFNYILKLSFLSFGGPRRVPWCTSLSSCLIQDCPLVLVDCQSWLGITSVGDWLSSPGQLISFCFFGCGLETICFIFGLSSFDLGWFDFGWVGLACFGLGWFGLGSL